MTTSVDAAGSRVVYEVFGHLPDGAPVKKVTLRGARGFEVAIITFGAAVQALRAPDREGRCADVVLGHDALAPYLARRQFFGATVKHDVGAPSLAIRRPERLHGRAERD